MEVTHVMPYFEAAELKGRKMDFEKNNSICHLSYEMLFTKTGKVRRCQRTVEEENRADQ